MDGNFFDHGSFNFVCEQKKMCLDRLMSKTMQIFTGLECTHDKSNFIKHELLAKVQDKCHCLPICRGCKDKDISIEALKSEGDTPNLDDILSEMPYELEVLESRVFFY